MRTIVKVKRAYEKPLPRDGYRILVDRLWPRGQSKEKIKLQEWAKQLAPTPSLRKWYGHLPDRWKVFQKSYRSELEKNKSVEEFIENHRQHPVITLVYASKDEAYSHALVLKDYLQHCFDDWGPPQ